MKQFKKLTRDLKIKMSKLGLQIDNWGLKEEKNDRWILVNKNTLREKEILKD